MNPSIARAARSKVPSFGKRIDWDWNKRRRSVPHSVGERVLGGKGKVCRSASRSRETGRERIVIGRLQLTTKERKNAGKAERESQAPEYLMRGQKREDLRTGLNLRKH